MNNKLPDIEIVDSEIKFDKRPVEDIMLEAKSVDSKKIAKEVIEWIIANVENFLDNQVKIFKLDLVLDNTDSMQEIKKLQDLYRAIPDDTIDIKKMQELEDIASKKGWDYAMVQASKFVDNEDNIKILMECREKLNNITKEALEKMKNDDEGLKQLFNRMVFYYEVQAIKDGQPIIQEQCGIAKIINFEYEAFSMGMSISKADDVITNGTEKRGEKQIIKRYNIPEGFTVWVEISFKPKCLPKSLF